MVFLWFVVPMTLLIGSWIVGWNWDQIRPAVFPSRYERIATAKREILTHVRALYPGSNPCFFVAVGMVGHLVLLNGLCDPYCSRLAVVDAYDPSEFERLERQLRREAAERAQASNPTLVYRT